MNIIFPNKKIWEAFWIELKDNWLDISSKYGKESFASLNITIMNICLSK
jgi:hypothetical protein